MEAVLHTERTEEATERRAIKSRSGQVDGGFLWFPLGFEALKQRLERRRQRDHKRLIPLTYQADGFTVQVNPVQGDGGFRNATPGVIANLKSVLHPLRLCSECLPYPRQIVVGYLGLLLLVIPWHAGHAVEGVASSKPDRNGVLHQHAKDFQFFQRGVFADRPYTAGTFDCGISAPKHIVPSVLGSEVVRECDAILDQEREQGAPTVVISLEVQSVASVPLCDELGHPLRPFHAINANQPFFHLGLLQKLVSGPTLRRFIPSQLGRLGATAGCFREANPPERRIPPAIKVCDSRTVSL